MTTLGLLRFLTPLTVTSLIAIAAVSTEFTLSQSLQVGSSATAAPSQRVRWTPKKKLGTIRSTLSGGRRGQASTTQVSTACTSSKGSSLTTMTLLVPNTNEGLYTTTASPTFFWHTNTKQAMSAQFILADPSRAEPIFSKTLQINQSGVSQVELPTSVVLQADTTYRWTVLLACKEGSSSEVSARSFIERIDEPMLLQQVAGQSDFDQAVSFAHEGIWYDAFNSLIRANQENPSNAALKAELKSLLAQAGSDPVSIAQRRVQVAGQL
ncbi:MAG: DUF928 domain-containing protein [Myxacorys chilensis ATA2-1-KO14]|nr:DUF928 domain-containing protein [Myxacorys chilensis ATA2-1-KO14]